jgi:hypothetical protein
MPSLSSSSDTVLHAWQAAGALNLGVLAPGASLTLTLLVSAPASTYVGTSASGSFSITAGNATSLTIPYSVFVGSIQQASLTVLVVDQ